MYEGVAKLVRFGFLRTVYIYIILPLIHPSLYRQRMYIIRIQGQADVSTQKCLLRYAMMLSSLL